MKNLVLAAASAFVLGNMSVASVAADADVIAAYDWSGGYIGALAGYGWGETHPTYNGGGPGAETKVTFNGLSGGLEAGYNWQAGDLVLGTEFDAAFSGMHGALLATSTPCLIAGIGCSADVDWLSTARVRVGFAADRFMPYLTGGLAIAGVKGTFDSPGLACSCDVNDVTLGWTIGGGVEFAINESWSAKAEYLYVDLGNPDIRGDNTLSVPGVGTDNYVFSTARVGLNYSF